MTAPPGLAPASSTTARRADKAASSPEQHALVRRTVSALTEMTGCRRSEARERVQAWLRDGSSLSDLEAWLRANFRVDPTGVTAVRNVLRGRS